jgi:hypothetical protein
VQSAIGPPVRKGAQHSRACRHYNGKRSDFLGAPLGVGDLAHLAAGRAFRPYRRKEIVRLPRVAARAPEVMIKVTGRTGDPAHLSQSPPLKVAQSPLWGSHARSAAESKWPIPVFALLISGRIIQALI